MLTERPTPEKVALRLLSRGHLFDGCSASDVEAVIACGLVNSFARGACIFWQNDPGEALYAIIDGEVEIRLPRDAGEDVLATLGVGDVFGEMAVATRRSRSASAIAATDVQLFVLNDGQLRAMLGRHPETAAKLLYNLLSITCNRLREEIERPRPAASPVESAASHAPT